VQPFPLEGPVRTSYVSSAATVGHRGAPSSCDDVASRRTMTPVTGDVTRSDVHTDGVRNELARATSCAGRRGGTRASHRVAARERIEGAHDYEGKNGATPVSANRSGNRQGRASRPRRRAAISFQCSCRFPRGFAVHPAISAEGRRRSSPRSRKGGTRRAFIGGEARAARRIAARPASSATVVSRGCARWSRPAPAGRRA